MYPPATGSSYGFGFDLSASQSSIILSHLVMTSGGKVVVNFSKASCCFLYITMAFLSCVSRLCPAMVISVLFETETRARTKVCDLTPAPSPGVIINSVRSRTQTHLPSTHTYRINMGPPPLRVLTVHPCRVFEIVE